HLFYIMSPGSATRITSLICRVTSDELDRMCDNSTLAYMCSVRNYYIPTKCILCKSESCSCLHLTAVQNDIYWLQIKINIKSMRPVPILQVGGFYVHEACFQKKTRL
ncbi:hypothetical protein L9F63_005157, partial [Diploptera punctata]